jgi:hypothetical protein
VPQQPQPLIYQLRVLNAARGYKRHWHTHGGQVGECFKSALIPFQAFLHKPVPVLCVLGCQRQCVWQPIVLGERTLTSFNPHSKDRLMVALTNSDPKR